MCHQWLFICSKFFLVSIFLSVEVYLFNDWHFYIQQKFINILQGVVYWMKNSVPQNPSSHVKIIQCGTKIKKTHEDEMWRLSSANFTWSILEYFGSNIIEMEQSLCWSHTLVYIEDSCRGCVLVHSTFIIWELTNRRMR